MRTRLLLRASSDSTEITAKPAACARWRRAADTVDMPVIAWVALVVLVPVVTGSAAGLLVRIGDRHRRTPAVAGWCTLVIAVLVLIVGYGTTAQSACGNTGCDTSYGVGAVVLAIPVFLFALGAVAASRSFVRKGAESTDRRRP
jgi:hypothetical protein